MKQNSSASDSPSATAPTARSPRLATITFAIAPEKIHVFKAIVESYDNLATLRTEDPRRHHLKLYFSADCETEVRALLDSMRERFAIEIIN